MTSFNSNRVSISDRINVVDTDLTISRSTFSQRENDTANLNDDLGWQVTLGVEVKDVINNTDKFYQAIANAEGVNTQVINDFFASLELNAITAETVATSVLTLRINNQTDTITITQSQELKNGNVASSSSFSSSFTSELSDNQAIDNTFEPIADLAIAVDNSKRAILTASSGDIIDIEINATDRAIAIKNTDGTIDTGKGADRLNLQARGTESYGIFGGTVNLGDDNDSLMAGKFGGGVNINAGSGDDLIAGFGRAKIDGSEGFDIFHLDAYSREDFVLSFGANNKVDFTLDGITLNTTGFEQFVFADDLTYTYEELA